jgi:hypothetical protein
MKDNKNKNEPPVNKDIGAIKRVIKTVKATVYNPQENNDSFRQKIIKLLEDTGESIRGITELCRNPAGDVSLKKTYVISSMFLKDCHTCLIKELSKNTDIESLIYVTGVEVGRFVVLSRILSFKMDFQTSTYARGNGADTHKVLLELNTMGHKLFGIFHTHLWKGIGAVNPSCIDINNQGRYEMSGYEAISGIFSRDGYFKCFSNKINFDLMVYGKGAIKHGDKTYRIDLPETHS